MINGDTPNVTNEEINILFRECKKNGFFVGILNYAHHFDSRFAPQEISVVKLVPSNYLRRTGQEFIDYMLKEGNIISNRLDNHRTDSNLINLFKCDKIKFICYKKDELNTSNFSTNDFDVSSKLVYYANERRINDSNSTMFFVELEVGHAY